MTSIAAVLSNLAGGSPQDPLAAPANAAGSGGIFAALLAATGAAPGGEGETAITPNPLNPAAASLDGQAVIEATMGDAALSQALSAGLGLPQDGAEIDAAIIEDPASAGAAATDLLLPGTPQNTEGRASQATPEATVQANQTVQATLERGAAPVIQAQRETKPQDQAAARAAGLENALNKASQTAREGGLENAENRPAQSTSKGEPQRSGLAQTDGRTTANGAYSSSTGSAENSLTEKPGAGRPEFAPRKPAIIQQQLQPGSGLTLIKFQQFTGGDPASTSSPPTLTVSVQAHAASPSPASASVPHVPVSALAVQIAQQASNGARRFDIRLDPPELGRIEVRLEVSRDGRVQTHLVVERSDTLDLLQRDARQLERALQDAGLNTSKEDMKFSLKGQDLAQGGDGQGNPEDDPGPLTAECDDDLSLIPNDAMPPPTRYMASTGLDIRI